LVKEEDFDGAKLAGVRVLIVSDARSSGQILRAQLAHLEMSNEQALTGPEAMEWLRRGKGDGHPFELAIIDLDLAKLEGWNLAQMIKSDPALASIKLMVLTSLGHRLSTATMQEM